MFFIILPNLKIEPNNSQNVITIPSKMEPRLVKIRLKHQSKNESDFEAQNIPKMATKIHPGTPLGASKIDTKNETKNIEKKGDEGGGQGAGRRARRRLTAAA